MYTRNPVDKANGFCTARACQTVRGATEVETNIRNNGNMIEMLVIALLIWLWLIERRLSALTATLKSLQLDMDGLRAMRSPATQREAPPPQAPAALPEVTSLHGASRKAAS